MAAWDTVGDVRAHTNIRYHRTISTRVENYYSDRLLVPLQLNQCTMPYAKKLLPRAFPSAVFLAEARGSHYAKTLCGF